MVRIELDPHIHDLPIPVFLQNFDHGLEYPVPVLDHIPCTVNLPPSLAHEIKPLPNPYLIPQCASPHRTPLCVRPSPQVVMDANRNPRSRDPHVLSEALAPLVNRCGATLCGLQLIWRTWYVSVPA